MDIRDWRKCISCGCHYDLGTNYDKCMDCRELKGVKKDGQKTLR